MSFLGQVHKRMDPIWTLLKNPMSWLWDVLVRHNQAFQNCHSLILATSCLWPLYGSYKYKNKPELLRKSASDAASNNSHSSIILVGKLLRFLVLVKLNYLHIHWFFFAICQLRLFTSLYPPPRPANRTKLFQIWKRAFLLYYARVHGVMEERRNYKRMNKLFLFKFVWSL